MAIGPEEIRRVAELARLELSTEEVALFASQLGRVVGYIDQLEQFEGLPEDQGVGLREQPDVPLPSLGIESFLANAPEKLDRFLVVPQVKKVDGG